jgi:hAT family C-terminal dimerisation region
MYRRKHKKETEALSTQKKDQYQEYLAEDPIDPPLPKEDEEGEEGEGVIIPYWRGVESKWPELARFAYDALSIPAMSTECERCFSSGSKTIEGRWALDGESIEACECQGQWIRRKFV